MINDLIAELERRCPGCTFSVSPSEIHIVEYGRKFIVDLNALGETAEEWFEQEIARHPADQIPPLRPDGRYRVLCLRCGPVVIGYGGYHDQMHNPNICWHCPRCGQSAEFDSKNYENYFEDEEKGGEKR